MTASDAARRDAQYFELGDFELQSGEVLEGARLAYRALGHLRADRQNAVLFPTYYTGTHQDNEKLVQSGRALDPADWFVVIPNLFGNGVSSSPSNHPTQPGAAFPRLTLLDNVRAQQRLLSECFGIERVALALGWSMGAQQAYHHAALFPERVARLLAVCGSARTSPHNWVFLAGVKAALLADPAFADGHYHEPPLRGLAAFGRVYAGWAYSQAFFRNHEYRALGFDSARALLMPVDQDLYFHPDDNRLEAAQLTRAELRVIASSWGHIAGGPERNPQASAQIDRAIRELLDTP